MLTLVYYVFYRVYNKLLLFFYKGNHIFYDSTMASNYI